MTTSPVSLTGELGVVEASRLSWLAQTTPEERKAIGETLRKHDTATIVGINALAADLFILVLCGDLSPSVALAAKPFLEFLTANTWQLMSQSGHGDQAPIVVTEQILQLKEKLTLRASYRQEIALPAPAADMIEAEVPEKVEAGR